MLCDPCSKTTSASFPFAADSKVIVLSIFWLYSVNFYVDSHCLRSRYSIRVTHFLSIFLPHSLKSYGLTLPYWHCNLNDEKSQPCNEFWETKFLFSVFENTTIISIIYLFYFIKKCSIQDFLTENYFDYRRHWITV